MNIFVLDEDPYKAAEQLCDKHVVKMILETAQILSTVAHQRGFHAPYKASHTKHPCTLWAGKSFNNWCWLTTHGMWMEVEYNKRYGKNHKSAAVIEYLMECTDRIWGQDFSYDAWQNHTEFAQCMPDKYKQPNAVDAYRAYYIGDKARFARWTAPRPTPDWFVL